MHTLIFFHDAALPHSQYLLKAFSENQNISQLTILYPKNRDHDLIYSASQGSDNNFLVSQNYDLIPVRSSRLRDKWGNFWDLFKLLRLKRPDYVIVLDEAYSVNVFFIGLAVKLLGLKAPVVCYGFENIIQSPPLSWWLKRPLVRLPIFCRKTIRYCLIDRLLQPIRSRLLNAALVPYEECAKFITASGWKLMLKEQWWAVDIPLFAEQSIHKIQFHESLGFSPDVKVIAYVGRFVPEKGIADLIKAIEDMDKSYCLVLIGDGPIKESLAKLCEQVLANRFKILPAMDLKSLASYMAQLDVLALPSHTEEFWKEQYGRVLVEAMAAGVPVIGSRSGAIPYVIGDMQRTFDEGSVRQIRQALDIALSMGNKERDDLKVRARRGDSQRFVQAYVDLYRELSLN